MFNLIKHCRICKHKNLQSIVNLGNQPAANSLKKKNSSDVKVPLRLLMCKKCNTLQISATINSKKLFSKYLWVTRTSDGIKKYRKFFIKKIKSKHKEKNLKVLEIASNDGFFLEGLKKENFKVLGIDPAKNLVKKANKKGIKTLPNFFNYSLSNKIKKNFSPDIVICRNVIPHVENINNVISGISNILKQNGKLYIEFHYAENLSKNLHYDYIYHEHIFYYTAQSISNLLKKHGLYSFDYFKSPISGGSLVFVISKKKIRKSLKFQKLLLKEKKNKINTLKYWRNFGAKCKNHKERLQYLITDLLKKKKTLAGYGASARSSTVLNYCNINSSQIKTIFDKNLMKKNLYTAGSNILITNPSPKKILKFHGIVILAWNFQKEIVTYLKSIGYKGKFISILPKLKIFK